MRASAWVAACLIGACGDGTSARPAMDAGARMDAARADAAVDGARGDGPGRADAAPDAAPAPRCQASGATSIDFQTLERIVVIGDARASTPGWTTSWPALLDAQLGQIVAPRLTRPHVVHLERAGASFASLAEAPDLLCACTEGSCVAAPSECLRPNDSSPTLVIVQLGTVDMLQVFLRLARDGGSMVDPQALVVDFRAQVRAALAIVDDPAHFTRKPALRVVGLVDPSDGTGDLDALVQRVFNLPIATHVAPADALAVLAAMNRVLEEEAGACGGSFVELGTAFLGHGLFFDDPMSPHYTPADPTPWLSGLYGVSARGAFELVRAVRRGIGATDPGLTPMFPAPAATLPMVPANGWAKSVVEAHITPMITADFGEAMNTATDPGKALGAPTGSVDAVALGVLGADVVLDLGAGTAAGDGAGDDLVVLEQGPMSAGIGEPYRVLGASAPGGPWTVIGDGYGEQSFDLGGAGPFRYVRVISLATLGDVVRGPGSPFFPGGEIDAVGAVYPR